MAEGPPVAVVTSLLLCVLAAALVVLLVRCMLGQAESSGAGRMTDRCLTLPFLPSLPLLGSLLSLRSDLPIHLLLTQLAHRYGSVFSLYMGPHYTVVVNDYTHAREVLLQKGKEFAGRPKMVTTDLLTRGGKDIAFADYSSVWKRHRGLVHSAFALFGEGSSKLQDIVLEAAEGLCEELLSMRAGQMTDPAPAPVKAELTVDLAPPLMRAVTNVVCRLVFSSSYRPHDPELLKVIAYNDGIVQTIARGGLVDLYPWLQIFPNKDLAKLKECVSVRDSLLSKKLEEHKMTFIPGEPRDLLDALLGGQGSGGKGQSDITDDHVLMTAAEAFGAGVETTSTTLLWTIALLLHHPEVQQRVQAELDECVGSARPPALSDRCRLPYLDATLCEVMRFRPVSPILIPHTALHDSSIGGHHVPKGTRVLVNMWAIHHDPQQWEQPECFRPERFLDDAGQRSAPPCFLPFGAGPRVCVGESLARMELFLFVSRLLQRFSFTPAVSLPDLQEPGVSLPELQEPGVSLPNLQEPGVSLPDLQGPRVSLPDLQGRLGVVLQPLPYAVTVTPRY